MKAFAESVYADDKVKRQMSQWIGDAQMEKALEVDKYQSDLERKKHLLKVSCSNLLNETCVIDIMVDNDAEIVVDFAVDSRSRS